MGEGNPQELLHNFLNMLSPLERKIVQYLPLSDSERVEYVLSGNDPKWGMLQQQYESIIKQIPREWGKYRERACNWFNPLPPGTPGRRAKDALATEAFELHKRGMNHPQIAAELNKRHGEGTATAGSVEKLLKRYYSDRTDLIQ